MVGPTAGRFLIDITSGVSAKQFVRGEWFVGTAILTSISFIVLRNGACGRPGFALDFIPETLIAFLIGVCIPPGGDLVWLGRAHAQGGGCMVGKPTQARNPQREDAARLGAPGDELVY